MGKTAKLQKGIRFDRGEIQAIEKDADRARRGFSDYVRYLVSTHPERGGTKKK